MLSLPSTVRIFASRTPVDLRKGFDKLAILVREAVGGDPLSGHLFVFVNLRGDRVKVLFWTRNGYCVVYKRLECGRFRLPTRLPDDRVLALEAAELTALLDGIDLRGATLKPAWTPPGARGKTRIA